MERLCFCARFPKTLGTWGLGRARGCEKEKRGLSVLDESIIERYTDQHARMPLELRERIEAEWDGTPVQLYALADLDASLKLSETWVALGVEHITIAGLQNGGPVRLTTFDRARIRGIREIPGLSCTQLVFQGEPGEPALALVRYTHRQRRAMENIMFILQQEHDAESEEHADLCHACPAKADRDCDR